MVVVEQKDVATSDDEAGSLDSFVCEDHDSDSDASDPGVSDDDDDAPPVPVPPPPPRRRAAPIVDAPLSDEDDAAPPVASEPQYAKAEAGEVASEDESAGSLDEFLADSASEGEEAAADDSTASEADEAPAAAPPKARRRVIEGGLLRRVLVYFYLPKLLSTSSSTAAPTDEILQRPSTDLNATSTPPTRPRHAKISISARSRGSTRRTLSTYPMYARASTAVSLMAAAVRNMSATVFFPRRRPSAAHSSASSVSSRWPARRSFADWSLAARATGAARLEDSASTRCTTGETPRNSTARASQ